MIPAHCAVACAAWPDEEISVYRDTYYDRPGRELTAQGRELHVRVIETGGVRRAVLTYKEPTADAASGSKPEHETKVADASVIDAILRAVGLEHLVALEKALRELPFHSEGPGHAGHRGDRPGDRRRVHRARNPGG
jgi:adenylate cyclase, class 2